MNPVSTYTDWLFSVEALSRLASTEEQNPLVGTVVTSSPWTLDRVASVEWGSPPVVGMASFEMPWLVAFERQDPVAYARAVAATLAESAGREVGGKSDSSYALSNSPPPILFSTPNSLTDLHAPAQLPNMPDLPPTANSKSNSQCLASCNSSPLSLWYARFLAERPELNTSPSSPSLVKESDDTAQILEDLRMLATWPRLRNATLPDPVVGGIDHDPTGVANRLGVKGLSVYTAFIERESLRCRVCGVPSSGMALALLHQRHQRHFQK